jgi:hypothetical protein
MSIPKIEIGVPIPPKVMRRGFSATLRLLKIGESALFETVTADNVRSLVWQLKQRGELAGARFTLRKQGENVRVWRIE